MLQPEVQMAPCLHKLLGINKPSLYNSHKALVWGGGGGKWVYDLMCTFPLGVF